MGNSSEGTCQHAHLGTIVSLERDHLCARDIKSDAGNVTNGLAV